MPTTSAVGRIAAIAALVGAVIVVLLLVLGGGSSYTVTAEFENASQLVTGNNVNVAGVPVGSVEQISLSNDGQALVKMDISDSAYTPLPQGTHATIRSQSLSGIANRYVDLALPTHPTGQTLSSGGQITQADTTSEVDLDELFNTLDKPTVTHLQEVIKGFARAYDGVGRQGKPRLLLPEPVPLHLAAGLRRAQLRPGQPRGPGGGRRRAHLHPGSRSRRRSRSLVAT